MPGKSLDPPRKRNANTQPPDGDTVLKTKQPFFYHSHPTICTYPEEWKVAP